jgi:hypothetical protein
MFLTLGISNGGMAHGIGHSPVCILATSYACFLVTLGFKTRVPFHPWKNALDRRKSGLIGLFGSKSRWVAIWKEHLVSVQMLWVYSASYRGLRYILLNTVKASWNIAGSVNFWLAYMYLVFSAIWSSSISRPLWILRKWGVWTLALPHWFHPSQS